MKVLFLDDAENRILIENAFSSTLDEIDNSRILIESKKFKASVVHSYYSMFSAATALVAHENVFPKTHNGLIGVLSSNGNL